MDRKTIKFLLKLLISAIFVAWIIFKVRWDEVLFYLSEVKFWQVLAYIIIYLSGAAISAHKWRILAGCKRISGPFREYFRLYLAGAFINNFMPGSIGGDTFRAYQTGKEDQCYPEAASVVMMDRITCFIGATILAVIFAALNWKTVAQNDILVIAYILVAFSFVIDIIVAKLRKVDLLKENIKKILPEKIIRFLRELWKYNNNSKILIKSIFLGAAFNFIGFAVADYFLFYSLGIRIGFLDYFSVIFLVSIVSAIPISINNIGLKEWAYITFFGIFGISSSAVISAAILGRFLQMLASSMAMADHIKNKQL